MSSSQRSPMPAAPARSRSVGISCLSFAANPLRPDPEPPTQGRISTGTAVGFCSGIRPFCVKIPTCDGYFGPEGRASNGFTERYDFDVGGDGGVPREGARALARIADEREAPHHTHGVRRNGAAHRAVRASKRRRRPALVAAVRKQTYAGNRWLASQGSTDFMVGGGGTRARRIRRRARCCHDTDRRRLRRLQLPRRYGGELAAHGGKAREQALVRRRNLVGQPLEHFRATPITSHRFDFPTQTWSDTGRRARRPRRLPSRHALGRNEALTSPRTSTIRRRETPARPTSASCIATATTPPPRRTASTPAFPSR